jgi:hypothetical protein
VGLPTLLFSGFGVKEVCEYKPWFAELTALTGLPDGPACVNELIEKTPINDETLE